jgi:putative endonuclease
MYFVYLLVSDDNRTYTGYTTDLKQRLRDHNAGKNGYTRGKKWYLAYYEAYASKEDAVRRERRLKDGRARRQLRLRVSRSLQSFVG